MYYYAFLDENDICTQIFALPAPISGSQYIAVASNDQSLVGQRFNRETSEFEPLFYYAALDDRGVVESVIYSTTQQTATDSLISITFAQYQTVLGMYWNGTAFVEPPISILALASTDEINYKGQEKWLSAKLDEMDNAIGGNASNISALSASLSTIAADMVTVANSLASMVTALDGKANATHAHTAADLTGVVKTVNGNAPDASGNITITNSGMTADEILSALKTVDGTGSGIDADTLDGMDSTAFATANHTHEEYAVSDHTHTGYATTEAMTAALGNKADAEHTHTGYATTAALENIQDDVNGKADTNHDHSIGDVTGLQSALNGKSDTNHTHTGYAPTSHSHSEYALENHSHSGYLPTSGGTVSGNLNVGGILRVNNQQAIYDSGTMMTLSTNNRETMIAGSKIYSKTTISVSSDERLKEGIRKAPKKELAELVRNLDLKTFKYIGCDEENVGVIAQELMKANPKLARYFIRTDEDGYYSVKTTDLVFALVAAVQELNDKMN
jgi:hypothetical protein